MVSATGTTVKIKWGKGEGNGSILLSWLVQVSKCKPPPPGLGNNAKRGTVKEEGKEGKRPPVASPEDHTENLLEVVSELTLPASSLSYKASKLEVGTKYTFRLAAVNIVGKGEWSEPLQASTTDEAPPPPPPKPAKKNAQEEHAPASQRQQPERGSRKEKKERDLAYAVKERKESERAEKERKRLIREASWSHTLHLIGEWIGRQNPMALSGCFVAFLVFIMMFVGIDEDGPAGPSF